MTRDLYDEGAWRKRGQSQVECAREDDRLPPMYAPATVRNRDFILDVLRDVLPTTGVILEIASGSGEHVVHFASNFPSLVFRLRLEQFTEVTVRVKCSSGHERRGRPVLGRFSNAGQRLLMASSARTWTPLRPWNATVGLTAGCGCDTEGRCLYLYGPYNERVRDGPEDPSIRPEPSRSRSELGSARFEAVAAMTQSVGFSVPTVTEMPANNLSVVFRRT